MTPSDRDLAYLVGCAIEAAREAGRFIAAAPTPRVEHKASGHSLASAVVTEVDRQSQALVLEVLRPTLERFGLALLSEEQEDDGSRLVRDAFWCIDPLDGTLPYLEGQPGYAVSIALVSREGTPKIGVVFDPSQDRLWHAIAGAGLFVDERPFTPPPPPADAPLRLFTDRGFRGVPKHDRILAELRRIAAQLGHAGLQIQDDAGAVLCACRTLAHPPACFFKLPKPTVGGGSLWDYAATACLFAEAGAIVSDIHGQPLSLNRAASTFLNPRGVLYCTDPALARQLRRLPARLDWPSVPNDA